MSDDFYSAFMMRGTIPTSTDVTKITAPGIYPVTAGNSTAPDSSGGALIALPPTTAPKLRFIKANDWNTYSLVSDKWVCLGSIATHDEGDFLSTSGGQIDGDVVINGALTTNVKDVVIESDVNGGFVGVHLKNESTSPNSSCGFDFSFGGAIMASVISGLLGDGSGATFLDFALSPAGDISDRREVAFTANAALRQLIFENGWSLSGYAQLTQFIINDGDAGYLEFPGGTLIQWTTGTTDVNGWGAVNFPLAWAQRCAIAIPVNVAGVSPATAVAGVKRLDDRTMQATLCGVGGGAVSSPFVIVGFGI